MQLAAAGRDDVSAPERNRAAPVGDDAAGALEDRQQRDDVLGLQLAFHDEV